jgi:hypothetical protein
VAESKHRYEEPELLATLRAPRRGGSLVRVYANGALAYQIPPSPKWIPSRISTYSAIQRSRMGGENLTPQQFIERYIQELGYTRVEGQG